MRSSVLSVLALLALAAAPAPVADAADDADVTLDVVGFRADYGLESWKRGAPSSTADSDPAPHSGAHFAGVYANPYSVPDNASGLSSPAWGYALRLRVHAVASGGAPADGDFSLAAFVAAPGGAVPAKLTKLNATAFLVEVDADGDGATPAARPLAPGEHELALALYRGTPDVGAELVAEARIPFRVVSGVIDKAAFPLPEGILPGYRDLGPGNFTPFHPSSVAPTRAFAGSAAFSQDRAPVAGAAAEVVVAHGRTRVVAWNGSTDANGRAPFSFEPEVALDGAAGGLVVVAAHLTGEDDARTLGGGVLALAATPHEARVVGVAPETNGRRPPLGEAPTALRVSVAEPGAPRAAAGMVHAMKGARVLASAELTGPNARGERSALLAAAPLWSEPDLESFGLFAFLVGADGSLHAFGSASRGLDVSVADVSVEPREQAALRVLVRNLNDNFDGREDPGLEASAVVHVTGLPGEPEAYREVALAEGAEAIVEFPLAAARPVGSFDVQVRVVAAELSAVRTATIVVEEAPSTLQRALAEAPAAPGALVAGVVAAAAVVAARYRDAAASRTRR